MTTMSNPTLLPESNSVSAFFSSRGSFGSLGAQPPPFSLVRLKNSLLELMFFYYLFLNSRKTF